MKKTLKTVLSLAFALLLVFQFAGSMDAHAATGQFSDPVITGGTSPELCLVTSSNSANIVDCWINNAESFGIVITPAEGVDYVVSVTVAGVDMSSKMLATASNAVKLDPKDLKELNLTAPVAISVVLDKIVETDYAAVSYNDGEASIAATLTNGSSSTLVNQAFSVPDLTAEAKQEALKEEGREFAGWELVYTTGASMEVAAGATIYPYADFTLTAQWNSVDAVTIRPVAQSKVYDGTAALVNDGSKVTDYEVYIYENGTWKQAVNYTVTGLSFAREAASKDIADVGTYTFTASGATVKDANGKVVNNVFYEDGTLTITARPLTVKSKNTEVVYTGDKVYPSGVEVVEPTTLAANQSIDESSITFNTYAIRAGGPINVAPQSFVIRDAANKDVTANYSIICENGLLTVTKRDITIAPADTTVSYDGKSHTIVANVTSGSLGNNDSIELVTEISGATNAGEYKNIKITEVKVYNELVKDYSTNSYNITWDKNASATLTITSHYLKIRPVSKTTIYAGPSTSLKADDYEIVEGTLLDGHEIVEPLTYEGTINVVADGVGVTKYSNIDVSSIKVVDASGADVTSLYRIETERGTLRIEPIDIVIIAGSNSASYSGNPITPDPKYTVVGNLLSNHKLVNVVVSGSQTYVGETVTKVTSYDIVDTSNNISVLGNNYYRVTLNDGKLIVTENPNQPQPETVTVSIKSLTKTYDGKPLSLSATDYTVTDSKGVVAAGGYELRVTVDTSSSITDAGSKDIAAPTVEVYKNGAKVTDYPFIIETKGGTLTVEKLVVTLTAASASKKYDGKALTCAKLAEGGATVGNSSGQLPAGHSLNKADIVYQGSQTNVGSSSNRIISATIRDANGNSVNKNYDLKFIDGVLTVTSAATTGTGTVAGGSATGDTSNIGLWIAIMAVLAVAAAAVVFIVIKKKKAEQ